MPKKRSGVRGEVQILPLDSVVPNTWNPNEMDPETRASLRAGLKSDGWIASQALLVWGVDAAGDTQNVIIDGEHRWLVARELKMKLGPMVRLDGLTQAEAKALTLKMQKRGRYNRDKVSELVRELAEGLEAKTVALDLGFKVDEVEAMLAAVEPVHVPDEDDTPTHSPDGTDEPAEAPTPKPTAIEALLSRHPVQASDEPTDDVAGVLAGTRRWAMVHGEALAFLQGLPDGCADAFITDPPYSSGGAFKGDRTQLTSAKYVQNGTQVKRPDFAGDTRDQRSFLKWATLWLEEGLRVVRPGSPIMLFTDWRQLPTMVDAMQSGGWVWRGIAPWNKTWGCRPTMGRFAAQCEYVVWGSAGPMPFDRDVPPLPGFYEAMVNPNAKFHQTGKPTKIMAEMSRIVRPDGVVLDIFAGSASTGLGCLAEGRRFIGVEKTADNFAIARARLLEGPDVAIADETPAAENDGAQAVA